MFWNNLYSLCRRRGTTPSSVVREVGISAGSVTKWKNGSIPSKASLERLAKYFGVDTEYFFVDHSDKETLPSSAARNITDSVLLNAYHAQPELQAAVNRLLGIEDGTHIRVYTAAHSVDKQPDGIADIDLEKWEKIKNAPDNEDALLADEPNKK